MGINKFSPNPRKFYKTNFVDLLELITPEVYRNEDITLSGLELNPISQVINSHIRLANNISNVISLSSVTGTQTANLSNISGIAQYFVKQNELTYITPYTFETKILNPLGTSLANFDTSSEFNSYLSANLLPKIVPASVTDTGSLQSNISTLSALTSNSNTSSVHNYLVDNLGWFYFLNTSANGGLTYSPSSYVLESLNSLYLGKNLETVDGIKGLTEYLWRNNSVCSFDSYIPTSFISGTADAILNASAGIIATYTSGIQKLDALKTLMDVVYSPLYIDQKDYTVRDAFNSFLDSGLYLDDLKSKGPYREFLNLLGFQFADISDEIENISLIYDIENVKDEQLQHIADLIGFKLRGNSSAKWRHQLRIAIDLYKSSGTLAAIQAAINSLIVDSVFDVSGKVQELWESYLPYLIWYSLGTESALFKNLNTWTSELALESGAIYYNTSSLEENLKIVTDTIILDLYKKFPNNFRIAGQLFDPPRLVAVDSYTGEELYVYTLVGEPAEKPFAMVGVNAGGFQAFKQDAKLFGESKGFDASLGFGALGSGVYFAGDGQLFTDERPLYLKPKGDLSFVFNYREKVNYPLPPFEEVKYYKDSTITAEMINFLVERLKCFKVLASFADKVGNYVLSSSVTDGSDLGTLNEWLMFFSSVQTPPNFDDVMLNISDYEKNLLGLWNGKSSHLFINFVDTDFNFSKTTYEGDGKYALYEAARVAREFSPAHAITRVNLAGSASDSFEVCSVEYTYAGLDQDDTRVGYTSGSILGSFEYSGVDMSFATGGGDSSLGSDSGRGGLNTFKRSSVDSILDSLVSSTSNITALGNVGRRSFRRRNLKNVLPKEGYYDRTGFNGPVSYDPSVLEYSMPSSLGELTLGYVASAGKFHPVVDPINPSGVWNSCEKLDSSRQFSGIFTSATFPYRGLYELQSNAKMPEVGSRKSRYVDRGQVPQIYITMNRLYEDKAKAHAEYIISLNSSAYEADAYWKNNIQSIANQAIASGLVLNSFSDYENFAFGKGLHQLHRDYCKYFAKHGLQLNEIEKTGGNIFGHVFGLGLYNCDFSLAGSSGSNFIATSTSSVSSINSSTVWNTTTVGTYVASSSDQAIVPLSGTFVSGNRYNAEFRNPHILSGIEFCNTSGAPTSNQFSVFKLDASNAVKGIDNPLINNTVIKCKSLGGLPRLRFDLSAYGDRRNYFIKDHKFNIKVKALVAEENSYILGGGELGVWIHTQPVSGVLWSWTPNNRWEATRESELSINKVTKSLSHKYAFPNKDASIISTESKCLNNFTPETSESINNVSLGNIKSEFFETMSFDFDTRNYTTKNNSEYLQINSITEEFYKVTNQIHTDNTNYIVEIFFVPNNNPKKYLLIESVNLEDVTLKNNASITTGYGTATSGTPLTPFVEENKIYLTKEELNDVLKFFNGLAVGGSGVYNTTLASRNATLTSGTLELSGGSRLNYRINPDWVPNTKQATYNNYTRVEFDN